MTTPALPAINWFEIPVADLDRVQTFYEAVLGQPLRREPRGPQALAVLPHAEPAVGGALIAGAHIAPPSASGTLVYLNVNPALQAALDRALAAGAQLLTPRVDLPDGMGSFVHVLDVQSLSGLRTSAAIWPQRSIFHRLFCPIAKAMGLQIRQKPSSLGPNFASTPLVRPAPSANRGRTSAASALIASPNWPCWTSASATSPGARWRI